MSMPVEPPLAATIERERALVEPSGEGSSRPESPRDTQAASTAIRAER